MEAKALTKLHNDVRESTHFEITDNGKIRCLLTGHEMPIRASLYEEYCVSRSFLRGLENDFPFYAHKDFIIKHKKDKHQLFCLLTKTTFPKKKSSFKKHIKGNRFQRSLANEIIGRKERIRAAVVRMKDFVQLANDATDKRWEKKMIKKYLQWQEKYQ